MPRQPSKSAPAEDASRQEDYRQVGRYYRARIAEPGSYWSVITDNVQIETATSEETDGGLSTAFTEFMAHLQQVSSQLSSLKTEFRTLEKRMNRELRVAQKGAAKRKAGSRQPSGFVKPTLISTELATFLGRERCGNARTEVAREINKTSAVIVFRTRTMVVRSFLMHHSALFLS